MAEFFVGFDADSGRDANFCFDVYPNPALEPDPTLKLRQG
jgi:hypothetical protein